MTVAERERQRLVWRPTSVAWPLTPLGSGAGEYATLARGLDEWLRMQSAELQAPSVRGLVDVDLDVAVGVWISAFETVRVRQFGEPVALRFVRVAGAHGTVVETGRELAPGPNGERRWTLTQPPGQGALWSIEADGPTRVLVERVIKRSTRYVSVEVEHEVLDWIAADEPVARMPILLGPDADTATQLQVHRALARELLALGDSDSKLERGVEAWRMAAAMFVLDQRRPGVRPYYARDPKPGIALEGTQSLKLEGVESREYRLAKSPRRWTFERGGPGQLRIAARTWAPVGEELVPAELIIRAGGRVVSRVVLSGRPARHAIDSETAFPRFEPLLSNDGGPVGEFAQAVVVLAPGKHDYELELVGGPALVSVEATRRLESTLASLRGRTPRKRTRAAHNKLGKSKAEAAQWLELLLSEQSLSPLPVSAHDPAFDTLAQRSPLLAVAGLALAASDERLGPDTMDALVERVRPWLATLAKDQSLAPEVRGQLRARWLALLAFHDRGELAPLLVESVRGGADPRFELSVEGLRLLAAMQGALPTATRERAAALALLELAYSRAPDDEGLRGQMVAAWSQSSRWSLLPARPGAGRPSMGFGASGEWLVPHTAFTSLLAPDKRWLRLDLGHPVRVRAALGPGPATPSGVTLRRMRLLDVYVASAADAVEPVKVQVDGRSWWSPQLFGVQRHRIAVPPGVHEIAVDGPEGTRAWSSLAPVDPVDSTAYARRERMWSLPDSSWELPGPAVPGYVRLRVRWPSELGPQPVHIQVLERGESSASSAEQAVPRTLLFDPRRPDSVEGEGAIDIDTQAVPIVGSSTVSHSQDFIIPIAAATTGISFEVDGNLPVLASLSLRRSLRPGDLPAKSGTGASEDAPLEGIFGDLFALTDDAIVAELRTLSEDLLAAPDQLDHRARRAALLLILGETGLARADLMQLTARVEAAGETGPRRERGEQLLAELEDRFDAFIEPRELVVSDPDFGAEPFLIEPVLAAVAGDDRSVLDPWLEMWASTRELPLDEALIQIDGELERKREQGVDAGALLLAQLGRTQRLSTDPARAREAGRAWLEGYGQVVAQSGDRRQLVAVGAAAVNPLLLHLDNPTSDASDAGVAFGLARELIPRYGHTNARRLAFVAASRSDWRTINHSEDSPSFERLELPVSELSRSPSWTVSEAILLSPWEDGSGDQLRPDRKGVLAWDASVGTVTTQLWCRAIRPDLAPLRAESVSDPQSLGRAKLQLRLRGDDGEELEAVAVEVADAVVQNVQLPIDREGRHRLELTLAADPMWLCSWRVNTRSGETDELVESRRRARWWTIESEQGAEFVVLGPASLQVESRAIITPDREQRPSVLQASVEGVTEEAELDGRIERPVITERRRRFKVAHASGHTLLLTDAKPYRIRLRTDRGRALVRVRARRDRGDISPPVQFSIRELRTSPEQPEPLGVDRGYRPVPEIGAREMPPPLRNRIGTFDGLVRVGLDELGDNEDFRLRFGGLITVGWRRELVEDGFWVRLAAQTRIREQSPVAAGGIVELGGRVAALGLRLGASLDVLAHGFGGRAETSVRASGFIDRPTWLGRFLQLRPSLDLGLRWQSLTPERLEAASTTLEPHPKIYTLYTHQHPLVVRPELELRGFPFQDLALWIRTGVVPNSNFRDLDHANFGVGLEGIGRMPQPWVPMWGMDYQASLRFDDADRSTFFVRHRIGAKLGVGVWANDSARFVLGVSNIVYVSGVAPVRDVIELWLRVDTAFGRRLRDYAPGKLWFGELWGPRGWGDTEDQASSTRGQVRESE